MSILKRTIDRGSPIIDNFFNMLEESADVMIDDFASNQGEMNTLLKTLNYSFEKFLENRMRPHEHLADLKSTCWPNNFTKSRVTLRLK